jgi:DNA-binding Lrp family transcriptional regulator
MASEAAAKLELKDRKILYELDKDARQSNSEIAKKVRLNKNTVNYKINRLLAEGIINGFYPVIDVSKLGYFSFRAYLKFFRTTPEKEGEIISWLKAQKRVGVVTKLETIYDFGFMIWVKNIYEFDDFWMEFKKRFRKYFWKENVCVFSKAWHFKRKYLLDEKKDEPFEFFGEEKIVEYDELDFRILQLLCRNARMPLVEISEQMKAPQRTVAFRIKQLEQKKIIQSYRVHINLEKIGYEYYKINMILDDFDKYESLMTFAMNHPNIIYIDRTLSEFDFEIDVEIKNRQELLKLLAEMKTRFDVRDMEIFTFKEYVKLELLPQT